MNVESLKKQPLLIGCGVIVIIGIIFLFWMMGAYNGLISKEEQVNLKWSEVQSNYQRRTDLIDNLVATVKGAANFEQKTLTDIVEARARVGQFNITPEVLNDPAALQKFNQMQGELSSALSRLLVVTENYPQLRATENFKDLQVQLEGTENRIKFSRDEFGGAVREYNLSVKRFPGSIIAAIFGFKDKAYFQADPGTEKAPKINFEK